ncbi:MAG: MarR family winged helix-turn-helix transcriptional regulator [Candidatus Saccharimonadales bacterium]
METNDRQVCEDLLTLVWHVKSTMFQVAESNNLTPVQLFALYSISQGGNSMGRVAENMHCDASNVTGVVDRLAAQGLVIRAESESDRRTKTLTLTAEGARIIQHILDALPERLGCDRLDEQEKRTLHATLTKLTRTV